MKILNKKWLTSFELRFSPMLKRKSAKDSEQILLYQYLPLLIIYRLADAMNKIFRLLSGISVSYVFEHREKALLTLVY